MFSNEINASLPGIPESHRNAFLLFPYHVGADTSEHDPAGGRVSAVQGTRCHQGYVERCQDHRGSV